jgi:hypothetical protein
VGSLLPAPSINRGDSVSNTKKSISEKTLKMMDSSMKSMAKGKVEEPIDIAKLWKELGVDKRSRVPLHFKDMFKEKGK